ncbi:hypothetical protein [Streptomyces sp. enrichment culture]
MREERVGCAGALPAAAGAVVAVLAAGVLALGIWGLLSWWTPCQRPEVVY